MTDLLQEIQTLQFSDKDAAEALLLRFLRETVPFDIAQVELRPLAVSLNSFNGFMTLANGERLFFKTHTETDTVIGEYYRAEALAKAGYPVIQPVFRSTEAGRQLLVYEVINDPSVFDLAWAIETGADSEALPGLTQAQQAADHHLLQLYLNSLDFASAEENAAAPVHQLFYHRLTGGRLARFYGPLPGQDGDDVMIVLPDGAYSIREVRQLRWEINGQVYTATLDELIGRSIQLLNPAQEGPVIVGHGDAHNGNVFFRCDEQPPSLLYFDPAFAGRHHPLLDLTKPLFHNVFAMWMYFRDEKRAQTTIRLERQGGVWRVQHEYALHLVRAMFLRSKVERVLIPIAIELKSRGWLRQDWRAYLKAALFCCPLLTKNLANAEEFPPEISLLGLAMAVQMGAESQGERSLIDRTLDEVEQALG